GERVQATVEVGQREVGGLERGERPGPVGRGDAEVRDALDRIDGHRAPGGLGSLREVRPGALVHLAGASVVDDREHGYCTSRLRMPEPPSGLDSPCPTGRTVRPRVWRDYPERPVTSRPR